MMTDSERARRDFLQFLGRAGLAVAAARMLPLSSLLTLGGCAISAGTPPRVASLRGRAFQPLPVGGRDDLELIDGLSYRVLIEWDTPLNRRGDRFGFNNDFIAWMPRGPHDAVLWVNHEYPNPLFLHGGDPTRPQDRTRAQIEIERKALGGSLLRVRRTAAGLPWQFVFDDPLNRRIDATTPIPFAWPEKIAGSHHAIGTLGNCAGGQTPWGTVLTCEENYPDLIPEKGKAGLFGWEHHLALPAEHYGWVVEVNPLTGAAKKLVALGRFFHECATFARARSGQAVVYMGDDRTEQCVYKFVSSRPDSLERGTLYVANLNAGRWIPLQRATHPELARRFATETELLIHAREAGILAGGTQLDRPEDVEVDPATGAVIVACTGNKGAGRPHGSLLRIEEAGSDAGALEFTWRTWIAGGRESGLTCPDNLVFDPQGGLWVTSDISGSSMGKPPYNQYGHNALFHIPLVGEQAGQVFRIAQAPVDAEFTGPCFSPDGQTLAMSVQHPGEESRPGLPLRSHWPHGGSEMPRPAVVMIEGFH